jgi:hypothetical protein
MKDIIIGYQSDAFRFVTQIIGAKPTEQQKQILDAISKSGAFVTVGSGMGTENSTVIAWLVLWFLSVFDDCAVAVTAPTERMLADIIWNEVRKWHYGMVPVFKDKIVVGDKKAYIKEDEHNCRARASTSCEAFQGWFAENILFLADQANAIPDMMFEVAEGSMSQSNCRMLICGSATLETQKRKSFFYRSQTSKKKCWSHWTRIRLPRVVDKRFINEFFKRYNSDSDIYKVRILGQFPVIKAYADKPQNVIAHFKQIQKELERCASPVPEFLYIPAQFIELIKSKKERRRQV